MANVAFKGRGHLQVVIYWSAGGDLSRHCGRPILVRCTEPSRVHEAEGLRVVKQRVENGLGIEHGHGLDVAVFCLEAEGGGAQLSVVVGKVGLD